MLKREERSEWRREKRRPRENRGLRRSEEEKSDRLRKKRRDLRGRGIGEEM